MARMLNSTTTMWHAEITLIDRGSFISYGACGIPYFVSDDVGDVKELMSTAVGVVRDAHFFKKVKGVTVRTNTEVTGIDRTSKVVHLREKLTDQESALAYNRLILATGSSPFIPHISNVGLIRFAFEAALAPAAFAPITTILIFMYSLL